MATEVVKIVDPDGGGDYSSLAAWEADFGTCTQSNYPSMSGDGDLEGADLIAVADCRCTSGSADTNAVTIDGWTSTGADNYIKIWTDPDQGYRHEGKWDDTKYRIANTVNPGDTFITISEDNVRIEGLQIKVYRNNYQANALEVPNVLGADVDIRISHNIIRSEFTGDEKTDLRAGIYVHDVDADGIKIWNNIVYNWHMSGAFPGRGISVSYGNNIYVYNNTVYNCYVGIRGSGSPTHAINNIVQNCYNNCFVDTFSSDSDFNCDDDSSAPGSNSVTGTVTFVDAANDDYHLDSSDTAAKDAGTDLSSDLNLAFTDDIDGETRSGTWDIGADEYVEAGGGQTATLLDTVILSEVYSPLASYLASLTDSLNMSGSRSALAKLVASLLDSANISDSNAATGNFIKGLSDSALITDTRQGTRHLASSISDSALMNDTRQGTRHLASSISDSALITDSINVIAHYISSNTDDILLSDTMSGMLANLAAISDTLNFVDTITTNFGSVHLSDNISLSDNQAAIRSLLSTISDVLTCTDEINVIAALRALLSDIIALTDEVTTQTAVTMLWEYGGPIPVGELQDMHWEYGSWHMAILGSGQTATLLDTVVLSEVYSPLASYLASLTDSLNMSGSRSALAKLVASLLDSIIMGESLDGSLHLNVNMSDNLSMSEQLVSLASYAISMVDAIGLSDQMGAIKITAKGEVVITFTSKFPTITVSARKPTITFH